MRLLYVSLLAPESPQNALRKALQGIATEFHEVDWMALRKQGKDTSREILAVANWFQPDLTFAQLQDPNVLRIDDAVQLPGKVVQWVGDCREPIPQFYYDLGKYLDLTMYSNLDDVEKLRAGGVPAAYLNLAYDPEIYRPDGSRTNHWPEIVFMGNHYSMDTFPLSWLRYDTCIKLKERYGNRLGIYGGGWDKYGSGSLKPAAEAECYRSCKIAISIHHFDRLRYMSDRPLRSMGCGAFTIHRGYPGDLIDFPATTSVFYNSYETLVALIDEYLENDAAREQYAETGQRWVANHHTWEARIQNDFMPLLEGLECTALKKAI